MPNTRIDGSNYDALTIDGVRTGRPQLSIIVLEQEESRCHRLVEVEELQQKLDSVQMYIDIGGKAEQFQTRMVTLLSKLGFQASPRAEGVAFFPGEEEGWKRLPSIRLTRAEGALTMRVHASDTLTAYNAVAVNSTPDDVYQRLMRGIVEAEKLYNEYGKKGTYVSVTRS